MSNDVPLATPVQSPLAALIGEWAGTTRTRFRPTDPFEPCEVKARMRWVANGAFVLYEYDGMFNGEVAHGAAFFGLDPDSGEGSAAWVDSFHSSAAPTLSKGKAAPGEILNVAATYGDPAEPWGWQTVITEEGPDTIAILAYNIPPASISERYVAIETKLQRVSAQP
ncbi:hypothetical protein D3C72_131660 [compost metagenome]